MEDARINKWVDFLDRTAWTFIQTTGASLVVLGFDGWKEALAAGVLAAAGAGGKTVVAQRVGNSGVGDAVPGASVVKTT
jgi:hypothetical protein